MTQLRPSNASRWMECGASVAMATASPDYHDATEDTAAEEGTAAHWVFEQLHAGQAVKAGDLAPNHVVVTEEMLDCGLQLKAIVETEAIVENKVDLSGIGLSEGTLDIGWRDKNVAHFMDYKFGHRFVDEFENWQMLAYASAFDFADLQCDTLNLHIFQPRCYDRAPHRVWTLSVDEFNLKYRAAMAQQVALIKSGNAPLRVGSHCYKCPAAASCPSLSDAGYAAIDELYIAGSPHVLNAQQLSRELDAQYRAEELLKARRMALEEQAHHVIRGGALVPGWERRQGQGRLKWDKTTDEVLAVGKMLGMDLAAPQSLITPTQAKNAGMSEQLVNSLSSRPLGKAKLSKVDINVTRKVFAK